MQYLNNPSYGVIRKGQKIAPNRPPCTKYVTRRINGQLRRVCVSRATSHADVYSGYGTTVDGESYMDKLKSLPKWYYVAGLGLAYYLYQR